MSHPDHRPLSKRRMSGRDVDEAHRPSTPLELLFDLTFVVAIAVAAAQLHHAVAEQHLAQGLIAFVMSFFAVWWAWMQFTWFASAYDTDDAWFRVMTMVQMVGVLILANGLQQVAQQGQFTAVVVGYCVMRLALVAMWLRAAKEHPARRQTCLRSAIAITLAQVLWVAWLAVPAEWRIASFAVLCLVELFIPIWALKAGRTPWHAHHIAERFGLFTIIVLGECVLGASNSVASAIQSQGWSLDVALVGLGSMMLILSLWWVYFLVPSGEALHHHRERAFTWSYFHAAIYMSLAALGAFLGVVADQLKAAPTDHAVAAHGVTPLVAISLVAIAVSVYLMVLAWISVNVTRHSAPVVRMLLPCLLAIAGVVAAVAMGLRLPWALFLMPLGPVILIVLLERGMAQRPEAFKIT